MRGRDETLDHINPSTTSNPYPAACKKSRKKNDQSTIENESKKIVIDTIDMNTVIIHKDISSNNVTRA